MDGEDFRRIDSDRGESTESASTTPEIQEEERFQAEQSQMLPGDRPCSELISPDSFSLDGRTPLYPLIPPPPPPPPPWFPHDLESPRDLGGSGIPGRTSSWPGAAAVAAASGSSGGPRDCWKWLALPGGRCAGSCWG